MRIRNKKIEMKGFFPSSFDQFDKYAFSVQNVIVNLSHMLLLILNSEVNSEMFKDIQNLGKWKMLVGCQLSAPSKGI